MNNLEHNNRNRILFIYKIDEHRESHLGINAKLQRQILAWERQGFTADSLTLSDLNEFSKNPIFPRIQNVLLQFLFFNFCRKYLLKKDLVYTIIFIRHTPLSIGLNKFLLFLRKKYPNTKITLDLPTYPYIHEYKGLKKILAKSLLPKNLKPNLNFISHLGQEDLIFEIPVIHIINTIDTSKIEPKNNFSMHSNELRLISVSSLWTLFGLSNLVDALKLFNDKSNDQKIFLTIVGDGPKRKTLEDHVKTINLSKYIKFTGFLFDENLNNLINSNDLGVGIITLDSKYFGYTQALKHRMYAGYGLPFFTNVTDAMFINNDSVLMCESKEIDTVFLTQIYDWYVNNLSNYETMSKNLRIFAEKHLSEEINVKKILTFVEKLNN